MMDIQEKYRRLVARIYAGDLGVNQAAEVGGLVGVALAVTAGVATQGNTVGTAIGTWFSGLFGG